MAEVAVIVGWDVVHVSGVDALLTGDEKSKGHCHAEDTDIAAWCVANGRILVAIDDDHKGGAQRAGVMRSQGVELIWIGYDPKGPDEHLEATVAQLPKWNEVLTGQDRAPRVWVQQRRGPLRLEVGKKRKSRRGNSQR